MSASPPPKNDLPRYAIPLFAESVMPLLLNVPLTVSGGSAATTAPDSSRRQRSERARRVAVAFILGACPHDPTPAMRFLQKNRTIADGDLQPPARKYFGCRSTGKESSCR